MDFVSGALFDGRWIRALTLVDNFTHEALAIVVDGGIRGEHVVEAVEAVAARHGAPDVIRVDNGPEFVSKALDRWAYERGVTLDFSRPGKPTDNAFVESFNGRLRDAKHIGGRPDACDGSSIKTRSRRLSRRHAGLVGS